MSRFIFKNIYLKYVILSVSLFFISVALGFLLSDLSVFIIGVLVAAILLIPVRSFWKIEKSGAYSFKNGKIVNVETRIKHPDLYHQQFHRYYVFKKKLYWKSNLKTLIN